MWQMLDLMSTFGAHIYNGCKVPFKTEIEMIEKNRRCEIEGKYRVEIIPAPDYTGRSNKIDYKKMGLNKEDFKYKFMKNREVNWELMAKRLWELLDDIDTAFDHYKPEMKNSFVNYVNHKSRERYDYMESNDGQTLQPKEIPTVEDLDPMCKWFKGAWKIEKLKS